MRPWEIIRAYEDAAYTDVIAAHTEQFGRALPDPVNNQLREIYANSSALHAQAPAAIEDGHFEHRLMIARTRGQIEALSGLGYVSLKDIRKVQM